MKLNLSFEHTVSFLVVACCLRCDEENIKAIITIQPCNMFALHISTDPYKKVNHSKLRKALNVECM